MSTISLQATVQRAELPSTTINNDIVMMSIETGAYYGLKESGREIWERLAQPTTVERLVTDLCQEYPADPQVIRQDVLAFLDDLLDNGLVTITQK